MALDTSDVDRGGRRRREEGGWGGRRTETDGDRGDDAGHGRQVGLRLRASEAETESEAVWRRQGRR